MVRAARALGAVAVLLAAGCQVGKRCESSSQCDNGGQCIVPPGICVSTDGGATGGGGGGGEATGGGSAEPLTLTVMVPAPPVRVGGPTHQEEEPGFGPAWKRDEKVPVKLEGNQPFSGARVELLFTLADGGWARGHDGGLLSWLGASAGLDGGACGCTSTRCQCLAVDLSVPPLPQARGQFKLRASARGVGGDAVVTPEQQIPVTRFAFRDAVLAGVHTPAFAPNGDLIVANGIGNLARVSQRGEVHWLRDPTALITAAPAIAPSFDGGALLVHVVRDDKIESWSEAWTVVDGLVLDAGCASLPGSSFGRPVIAMTGTGGELAPGFFFARHPVGGQLSRPTATAERCEALGVVEEEYGADGLVARGNQVFGLNQFNSALAFSFRTFGATVSQIVSRPIDGGVLPGAATSFLAAGPNAIYATVETPGVSNLHSLEMLALSTTKAVPERQGATAGNTVVHNTTRWRLIVQNGQLTLESNGAIYPLGATGAVGDRGWLVLGAPAQPLAAQQLYVVTSKGHLFVRDALLNSPLFSTQLAGIDVTRSPNLDCNVRSGMRANRPGLLVVPTATALYGFLLDSPGVFNEAGATFTTEHGNPRNTSSDIWAGQFSCQ